MIIALSGWKQSGKDSAAKILIEEFGFKRIAFADVLKDMVAEEYGIPRNWMDDPNFKEKPILSLPVNPQDKFSEHMLLIQRGELRDAEGNKPENYDYGDIKLYHTPRSLCILKGSVNRFVDPNYWVKRSLKDVEKNIVITDMRYHNEANQVIRTAYENKVECKTVRIERFTTSPSSDSSERDLDSYDFQYRISNTGTVEEYHDKIRELANEWMGLV